MKKEIDCQVFEDQLDALMGGALPDEGLGQLRVHALSCPDCAMLLRVQEHLALPTLRELEASVPEHLLASVWPTVEGAAKEGEADRLGGVSAETSARDGGRADGSTVEPRETFEEETSGSRYFPWLIPTLAAASVVLLFSTGFLFSELRQTKARGLQLAEEVEGLHEEMAEFGAMTEWIERTAQLAGARRARALDDALGEEESITLGALVELLGGYPSEIVLLEASQLQGLLGTSNRPPPELREIFRLLADEIGNSGEIQEVRAGDLAQWIAESGLPAEMVLPKSQLIELLS